LRFRYIVDRLVRLAYTRSKIIQQSAHIQTTYIHKVILEDLPVGVSSIARKTSTPDTMLKKKEKYLINLLIT
jgi:hypothetical protein